MLGYLVCAAVYAALLAACLTFWRRRLTGSALTTALLVQVAWSVTLAAEAAGARISPGLQIAVEYVRALAWALVLARCLGALTEQGPGRAVQRALAGLVVLAIIVLTAALVPGEPNIVASYLTRYWLWGGLMLCIGGLVLVEQVARNTRSAQEWSVKHVWLAIGALFSWDLCLYSIAMLHGGAAEELWVARGFVNALIGGVLAIGLRRITHWQPAAFLSPRLIFFNATLLGASLYVLAMAAGSYFIRDLGGSWGAAGQMVFLAAAALVLIVAVRSEQFRAWLRVMLAKHLFPYRYDYREEWQKLTRALSESDDTPIHERIAKVMARTIQCASGGLWLKDVDAAFAPAGGDLAPANAPRESGCAAFFDYLLDKEWICDLDETRAGRDRGMVPQAPAWMLADARMWLVVPLICDKVLIGFVALGQPLATMRLTWEEIDLLRAAGRQIASFLAFEQAAKRLAEAHQFEAMNRLSAFLMHDLRHLIAQQALVVQNAARHRGNPQFFDDAILTVDNSVRRMTRLMDELRRDVLTEQVQRVELSELGTEIVRRTQSQEPAPKLAIETRGVEVVLNRNRMLQVLEHVVRNAQDATPAEGSVSIKVRQVGQRAIIEVADTGAGMDADFVRNRLFRPFDTTKGERGLGIGAYEAREFVRKCGGNVEVDSTLGKGTQFIISLPLAPVLGAGDSVAEHELQTH